MARIYGNSRNNSLNGTNYGDVIQAYGGNDTVYGRGGNDVIYGGTGSDRLYGGDGRDTIYGNGGTDYIYGGAGADMIYSGGSYDYLWGGTGGDGFVFKDLHSDGGGVAAYIKDFSRAQGDYIHLGHIDGNPGVAGNQALPWRGYDANGGPANDGADARGVSYHHVQFQDGGWQTIVNVRNKADAGYNDANNFTQIWIDGRHFLTPDDFIL